MSDYRVNGKTVERRHRGQWVVAYYCTSEERAKQCLIDCKKSAAEWANLPDHERARRILRKGKDE